MADDSEKKSKISKTTEYAMVLTALMFDIAQLVTGLLVMLFAMFDGGFISTPISYVFSYSITAVAGVTFFLWFKMQGINFFEKFFAKKGKALGQKAAKQVPKLVARLLISLGAQVVPVVNLLVPSYSLGVFFMIKIIRLVETGEEHISEEHMQKIIQLVEVAEREGIRSDAFANAVSETVSGEIGHEERGQRLQKLSRGVSRVARERRQRMRAREEAEMRQQEQAMRRAQEEPVEQPV